MLFVMLRIALRPLSKRAMNSQAASTLALMGYDLVARALPSCRGEADAQKIALSQGRPYAVAPLWNREGQAMLHVTLWGDQASEDATALLSYLALHPLLEEGQHRYLIQSVSPLRHAQAALATWADLMVPCNDRVIGLRFVTPTIFQEPPVDEHLDLDFPEPSAVFTQLLQRWVHLGGPSVTGELHSFLEGSSCVVSNYRLHTRQYRLPGGVQIGWIGWVLYTCRDQHSECTAALHSLARLACFTGAGFATDYGMGLTILMHR
jgi:CRISPR/Cas system endoribonuclease Cas6 (RAMP superfamily)